MGLSVDTSQNYLVWGNTESVTYTSHASDADTLYTIATIKRRPLTWKELTASGGVYTERNRVWLLPQTVAASASRTAPPLNYYTADTAGGLKTATSSGLRLRGLAGVTPKPADWLTDSDGIRWTVLEADFQALKSTWKLTTLSLTLAFDLRDSVSYWPVTDTQDATGARVATFPAASVTNIPARIQPVGGDTTDERGQRLTRRQFTIFLGQQLDVRQGSRLVDQNGIVYEVESDSNAGRIDQVQEIQAEIRNW